MKNSVVNSMLWVFVIIVGAMSAFQPFADNAFMIVHGPNIMVSVITIFAFIHGALRYGWKIMFVFFLIATVAEVFFELLGTNTGFPFGSYHYTSGCGPMLFGIPILLPVAYFQMIYITWTIAHVLIDKYSNRLQGKYVLLVPVMASFIMVMWDFVIDPASSTDRGQWVWASGGAHFGVPFSNYMGWFLCVFVCYFCFALYMSKEQADEDPQIIYTGGYWLQAILMYAVYPLNFLFKGFVSESYQVVSLDNHVWWSNDLYQTAALTAILTMYFVVVLAFTKVAILKQVPQNSSDQT